VRIAGEDHKTRVALAQYIARAPLSMDKLSYLPSQGKVSYSSDFNPASGDTIKVWDARTFIAAATLFIPRRVFGLFTTSVCILPAAAGSGPSGLMWFLTPPGGGRRITV
jgi:hypothetical protein